MSVSDRATRRDLRALFEPESVAVVGASDDPEKWGNWLARGALRGASRRGVHLVNRRGGEVMGRPAHRSLTDLPEAPELAVLAVPPAALAGAVDDAIAAGCRALVVITAGEADGDAGGPRDAALARQARDAGVIMLGPNCLGVFDAGAELELVSNDLPRGSLGLISQSGNLALEIGLLAGAAGLGFSRFVSVGNQADLEAGELIGELAAHDGTELIAIYVEDFRDGRSFARAAEAATRAGKPVVLLAVEHTEATARAVRSHTGALASDSAAIDAACRAAGMERVRSPQELVDLAQGLVRAGVPRGRRVAVLADGGGHGGVAAALASEAALAMPALSEGLRRELRAGLPPTAAVANPIDLAGGGEADIHSFERTARAVLGSGEVDAVLMTGYFGGYSDYAETLGRAEAAVAEALADAADATGRPLVVQTMHPQTAAASTLRSRGVPVYPTIERAVGVLARLAEAGERVPRGVPALPEPAVAGAAPLGVPARQTASSQGEASSAPASADSRARASPTPVRPPSPTPVRPPSPTPARPPPPTPTLARFSGPAASPSCRLARSPLLTRPPRPRPSSAIRSCSRRSGFSTSRTWAGSSPASRTSPPCGLPSPASTSGLPRPRSPSSAWRPSATASSSSWAHAGTPASARSPWSASAVCSRRF